jgi:hypothetical protein
MYRLAFAATYGSRTLLSGTIEKTKFQIRRTGGSGATHHRRRAVMQHSRM